MTDLLNFRKMVTLLIVLTLFWAGAASLANAAERIVNGGFETGNFKGWSIGALSPLDPPAINSSGAKHSGTFSAAFKTTAYIEQGFSVPLVANGDLIYWESSTGTGYLVATVIYADNTRDQGRGTAKMATGPWRQYIFAVNKKKKIARIRFECTGGETMGVFLDDVSLVDKQLIPVRPTLP